MPGDPQIIVDAHEDIAANTLLFGRDFTQSAYAKRKREAMNPPKDGWGTVITGLPDALLGRVGIIFGTLFVAPAWAAMGGDHGYETPAQAYKMALDQIDVYYRLAETNERILLVRTQNELDAVLATWAEGVDFEGHKLGLGISIEGADSIPAPQAFE